MILAQGGCRLHQEVGYHDFEGLAQEEDEVPRMLADLGDKHTLIMRNHGMLSVGATLGEAFGFMRALIDACTLQTKVDGDRRASCARSRRSCRRTPRRR